MVLVKQAERLGELLAHVAESLDIPDHMYENAIVKYEDVGTWLGADDSDLNKYEPDIYPQGSFRLGTMVKPLSEKDEYDIDLVCHLSICANNITKDNLKKIVGTRLKMRKDISEILEESRRCWTLAYPNQFHMDVLPAIPNDDNPPTGIVLTDKELRTWQSSDPKAYAEWFYDRMKVVFNEKRGVLAASMQVSIEEVPVWRVKTPLQRAVQLLKRHRDMYFQHDLNNRPVSIIITTLAARAYRNQADLYDATIGITKEMPSFIECRNGKWWVANPVDPNENFADKWNEKPERREKFFAWVERVYEDFHGAFQRGSINEATRMLAPVMGHTMIRKAAAQLGIVGGGSELSPTIASEIVPALTSTAHCLAPQWLLQLQYNASVTGGVYAPKKKQPKKLWDITNRPLPKGVDLKFTVKTNVPRPFTVKWQVVNTGREAAEVNQLRGDFYNSENAIGDTRWECTQYAGTHWVEAFVIKDDICVARSGKKYIRIRA